MININRNFYFSLVNSLFFWRKRSQAMSADQALQLLRARMRSVLLTTKDCLSDMKEHDLHYGRLQRMEEILKDLLQRREPYSSVLADSLYSEITQLRMSTEKWKERVKGSTFNSFCINVTDLLPILLKYRELIAQAPS